MERSARTAFVYNLPLKAGEREVYQFFSKVGKVVDIKLITDKVSKRSKGFAYIEYSRVGRAAGGLWIRRGAVVWDARVGLRRDVSSARRATRGQSAPRARSMASQRKETEPAPSVGCQRVNAKRGRPASCCAPNEGIRIVATGVV